MNKKSLLSAFLTAIIISGLILVSTAHFSTVQASTDASGLPKPSIPEFTLKFEAHPYDVPPTYGIDPYTGENVTIAEGGHVENKSIVVTIKNQPSSGDLYYNVRYKGHFGGGWTELYYYELYSTNDLPRQSNSEYTVLSLLQESLPPDCFVDRAQVDVQVEALLWHNIEVFISDHPTLPPPYNEAGHYETRYALNETSGWSNTQTITIGESQTPTSSPTTTPSPTPYTAAKRTEQETIAGAAITAAVIVAGLGLLIYLIKRK